MNIASIIEKIPGNNLQERDSLSKEELKKFAAENKLASLALDLGISADQDALAGFAAAVREISMHWPSLGIALCMHSHIVFAFDRYRKLVGSAEHMLHAVKHDQCLVASAFADGVIGSMVFDTCLTGDDFDAEVIQLAGAKLPCTLSGIADYYCCSLKSRKDGAFSVALIAASDKIAVDYDFWAIELFKAASSNKVIFDQVQISKNDIAAPDNADMPGALNLGLSCFNLLAINCYFGVVSKLIEKIESRFAPFGDLEAVIAKVKRYGAEVLPQLIEPVFYADQDENNLVQVLLERYKLEALIKELVAAVFEHVSGIALIRDKEFIYLTNMVQFLRHHPISEHKLASISGPAMETWSDKLDFNALAQKYGTPLYVFSPEQLGANLAAYATLVGKPEHVFYPVKANPSMAVLRELQKLGCGLDCATSAEVDLGLLSGFSYDRFIYNSPAPDYGLIKKLLAAGAKVVIDSHEILLQIEEALDIGTITGKILVRVNPESSMEYLNNKPWIEMTQHASDASKFGIPSESVVDILSKTRLPVSGLHIHVGTQMDHLDVFRSARTLLHRIRDEVNAGGRQTIDAIDFGGGLGINFLNGDSYPDIHAFADALASGLATDTSYYVEPGQSLVGNTMGLLTRVQEIKNLRDKKWAILDVGSNELMKVCLLKWQHRILDDRHAPLPDQGRDAVGGPLCFAGDVLLTNTSLKKTKKGDALFIQHAGAYCSAASNNFNGFKRPAMLAVERTGGERLIEREEDAFCMPAVLTFRPTLFETNYPEALPLDRAYIDNLSSKYLRNEADDDRFDIIETCQVAAHTLSFKVQVDSPLGALSMHMAVRVMADIGIVTALHFAGKKVKDVSVWGTRLYMTCDKLIKTGKPLNISVNITPSVADGEQSEHLAYIDIEQGKFVGTFKFTF